MKAYVTSIGEKTEAICCEQLRKFGFEIVLLNEKEPWIEKYKKFLNLAYFNSQDCIRVDADIIVNQNILALKHGCNGSLMGQAQVYDFYQNDLHTGGPIFYSKDVIKMILDNFHKLDEFRPETSAWRLPDVNPKTITLKWTVVGLHGFFQDEDAVARSEKNKIDRKQISKYDFDLARALNNL